MNKNEDILIETLQVTLQNSRFLKQNFSCYQKPENTAF